MTIQGKYKFDGTYPYIRELLGFAKGVCATGYYMDIEVYRNYSVMPDSNEIFVRFKGSPKAEDTVCLSLNLPPIEYRDPQNLTYSFSKEI